MPILAPAVPLVAGAGGGTATAGGGAALFGGITAAQVATAGAVIASAVAVGALVDDYLDTPVGDREAEGIATQAGEKSKADRRALTDCATCQWCQINIQAQGSFLPLRNRSDPQGIGPYLVQGRTVTAREGVIIAGLTHEWAKSTSGRGNFKQIERWNILAETIKYINSFPPYGLAPSRDNRPGKLDRYTSQVRYDINVEGTINAFMVP